MSTEVWRAVPDFPGYMASSEGRIRSHVRNPAGRLMAPVANCQSGYLQVCLQQGGRQRSRPVHVLVALAFHGPRPDGMVTRHLDGSRTNNRPDNLAWGTPAENSADRERHGTVPHDRKTRCPAGHPYEGGNVKMSQGHQKCRRCNRELNTKKRGADPMVYVIRQWALSQGIPIATRGRIPDAIRRQYALARRERAA